MYLNTGTLHVYGQQSRNNIFAMKCRFNFRFFFTTLNFSNCGVYIIRLTHSVAQRYWRHRGEMSELDGKWSMITGSDRSQTETMHPLKSMVSVRRRGLKQCAMFYDQVVIMVYLSETGLGQRPWSLIMVSGCETGRNRGIAVTYRRERPSLLVVDFSDDWDFLTQHAYIYALSLLINIGSRSSREIAFLL